MNRPPTTRDALDAGDLVIGVIDGDLVLTVPSERLDVCDHCPGFHVVLVAAASPDRVRQFAAAIAQLVEPMERVQ